ncbi:RNA polymerase sigma factor [Asticcacaulis solisilvae]|uniref:RNA polymerase sigma factor n=1 Tax=Asticcacaulis solisilvae TaxID=1217274 RepID=UPI003FD8CB0D
MSSFSRDILFKAYVEKRDLLVRYFTRVANDAALAEDIVQDLYLRIEAIPADDTRVIDDATAFLFRMAHNIHRNQIRTLDNSRRRDTAWHSVHHDGREDAADGAPSPEDAVSGRQQMAEFTKAVEDLPERTQAIFRLHKFDGVSQAQVAARLGISLSSVEKHLGAALKHLTARLRPGSRAGPGP